MTIKRSSTSFRRLAGTAVAAAMAIALVGLYSDLAAAGAMSADSRARVASKAVSIKGFAFRPGTTRVKKGARVSFANRDGVAHTATGRGFDTGTIAPGKSKRVSFNRKGTFVFHCSIHPTMHGKVIVE
jgi:plastocyanin